ncbi:MAG: MlaD family protein, partial [Gemmatimonadota bacterium]|nr:MlaD family protein [Gemmatimonadota bacterium]
GLSPSVQDIKADTPVLLQGLSVGEVAAISPIVDSGTMGPPQFLVELRLRDRYPNGEVLTLPIGTSAEIGSSGLLGAASIALLVPSGRLVGALIPGDTIRATIQHSATDALKEVADSLKTQISDVLRDARSLLASLERTSTAAEQELRRTGPEVRLAIREVRSAAAALEPLLRDADSLVLAIEPRVGLIQDSLLATLSEARSLLRHSDSLTQSFVGLAEDIRPDIKATAEGIAVVTAKLEFFVDQVSRRPYRMFSGVRLPPRDSLPKDSTP